MKIKDRIAIYDEVRERCEVVVDNGIHLEIKIKEELYSKLKTKVEDYKFITLI